MSEKNLIQGESLMSQKCALCSLIWSFHSSSKPSLSLVCPRGVVTEMSFTLNKVHLARLNLIFLHWDRRTKVWTSFVLDKVFSSTVASTTAKSLGWERWETWESFRDYLGSIGRPKRVKSLLPTARSFSRRILAPIGAPRSARTITRSPVVTCGEICEGCFHRPSKIGTLCWWPLMCKIAKSLPGSETKLVLILSWVSLTREASSNTTVWPGAT